MTESKAQKSVEIPLIAIKCRLCLEIRQELKTLNCQHSFCLGCLQDWMKKKGALECPACCQSHSVPEGGLCKLPSNTIKATETASQGNVNTKCCCGKNSADFCQTCSQYLCASCTNYHKIFPPLRSHTLQPIESHSSNIDQQSADLHSQRIRCGEVGAKNFVQCQPAQAVNDNQHAALLQVSAFTEHEQIGRRPMQCEEQNENIFEIVSKNPMTVTSYQPFLVEIAQSYKCKIEIKNLTAPKEDCTIISAKTVRSEGNHLDGSSSKELTLDVKFNNYSIKGSPIKIIVEPAKVVRFIRNVGESTGFMGNRGIQDLVMSDNGWFLVACNKREVFKFENSGAFVSKIKLTPLLSKVKRICKLNNNYFICCDWFMRRITFFKHNGQEIKSISTGLAISSLPSSISVDENLNVVYVADETANCVHVYEMESNLKVKTIGCYGGLEGQMNGPSDVAVTKKGNLIVADTYNHRVQLFGSDGQLIQVLIGGGDEDGMVLRPLRICVDDDDNIIVASECKVQLFDNHGKFIRVIHQIDKEENKNFVISIVSHYPRRLAIAELNSIMIVVINY
ncbi:tripartite motif-containing protein 3-like [Anneissia japonica]|uniref:tripartite motif-containing protein 3-like n=1 Tax=Anneissia japonica TaxID=1529436 RepID=UPI001425AA04|nr:tripartite motif-containing protein 3-like [Anneissia japonica]XP_033095904.1 tripartite motif-containing protein 3-like [Anneissia japonica]